MLAVLCVTEITSWGALYYAFPVLAPSIAADTGWSVPTITAAFSAGLVVSAVMGIPAGRWLDRIGPRPVMMAGSVLAVPALLGIAWAPTVPLFVAAWVLAGAAMAGTLYPPAFAALTRWWGSRRVVRSRAFLMLLATIVAGSFAAFAVVVNQVPLLNERGLSTSVAAWALGLGGLGQVLGRLGYGRLAPASGVRARSVAVLGFSAAATALVPGPAGPLIAAAMLAGAARGIFTLLQATAVTDRWGAERYGRLNGIVSAPAVLATAVSPWAGAALAGALGGYPAMFLVLAGIAGVAALLAVGTVPR